MGGPRIEAARRSPAARRIEGWLLLAIVAVAVATIAVGGYWLFRTQPSNGPPEPSGAWERLALNKITGLFRGKDLGYSFADEVTPPMREEIDRRRGEYIPEMDRAIYLSPSFAAEQFPKSISLVDEVEALLRVCFFAEAEDKLLDRVSTPDYLGRTVFIKFNHNLARGRVRLVVLVLSLTQAANERVAGADHFDPLIVINH